MLADRISLLEKLAGDGHDADDYAADDDADDDAPEGSNDGPWASAFVIWIAQCPVCASVLAVKGNASTVGVEPI